MRTKTTNTAKNSPMRVIPDTDAQKQVMTPEPLFMQTKRGRKNVNVLTDMNIEDQRLRTLSEDFEYMD